jgi:hypothetical protein
MSNVYGKIRVLKMTKSAKIRVKNLGEPYKKIREFWLLEGSVLAQSSAAERKPTHHHLFLNKKTILINICVHDFGVHYEYVGMSFVFGHSTKKKY